MQLRLIALFFGRKGPLDVDRMPIYYTDHSTNGKDGSEGGSFAHVRSAVRDWSLATMNEFDRSVYPASRRWVGCG